MAVTSVRLSPDVEQKLQTVAGRARRTKSWLINEAVKDYLERLGEDERRWAETVEALASVKAGRVVGGDEMMEWIAAWGKKAEKKPPRCIPGA
ncbi:MAG: CopG family ribbon-helix-helix protein [Betaproteobacteria bacterium]